MAREQSRRPRSVDAAKTPSSKENISPFADTGFVDVELLESDDTLSVEEAVQQAQERFQAKRDEQRKNGVDRSLKSAKPVRFEPENTIEALLAKGNLVAALEKMTPEQLTEFHGSKEELEAIRLRKLRPELDKVEENFPEYASGGRTEVRDKLGQGGMGAVYLIKEYRTITGEDGKDREIEFRDAILKVIRPHLLDPKDYAFGKSDTAQAEQRIKEVQARFIREVQAMTRPMQGISQNPHVATVHEFVELKDGGYGMVMEKMKSDVSSEVKDRFKDKKADEAYVAAVATSVAKGLKWVHKHGYIHRDVKPANILSGGHGVYKLADFGIAGILSKAEDALPKRRITGFYKANEVGAKGKQQEQAVDSKLTMPGAITGSPFHMSPEQVEAKTLDWRSDAYSLGSSMYEMLAGKAPYYEKGLALTPMLVRVADKNHRPESLPNDTLLSKIVMQLIEKNPDDRVKPIPLSNGERPLKMDSMEAVAEAIKYAGAHADASIGEAQKMDREPAQKRKRTSVLSNLFRLTKRRKEKRGDGEDQMNKAA